MGPRQVRTKMNWCALLLVHAWCTLFFVSTDFRTKKEFTLLW